MGKNNFFNRLFRSVKRDSQSVADVIASADASLTVWPWDTEADTPMKIATVYQCMRLLSTNVAKLPLRFMKRNASGVFSEKDKGRLRYLLEVQPMEMMSAFDFWRQTVQQMLGFGNAYILIFRNSFTADIDRFILCSPNSCYFDRTRRRYVVNDDTWGINGEFAPEGVIHLRNISEDGIEGRGVFEYARLSTEIASAGDRETRDRFRNGGNVRGFFTNAPATVSGYNPYSDKLLKKVAEKQDALFRTGGRLSYLPGGMQFKELMLSSTDMQFLESRKFTVREICRFFGVSPSFVFDDTSNNYKSVEQASADFLKNALDPILVQIEQEFRRKLLTEREALSSRFEFDRRGLMTCDLETRVRWQTARIAAGIDTVNEARAMDNREPVEGGDNILISANLRTIEDYTQTKQDTNDTTEN